MNLIQGAYILAGGKIFGGDAWEPPRWEEAVLVQDGTIRQVGAYEDLRKQRGSAREIDLGGAMLLRGLCDAHLHMAAGGYILGCVDLGGKELPELERLLKEAGRDARNDRWIEAYNLDETLCQLDAAMLEQWLPGRRVVVHKRDLHGCCASLTALKEAWIDGETDDPPKGKIGRDASGTPTGMLYEAAMGLVYRLMPEATAAERKRHILLAQDYLSGLGLAAVSEALNSGDDALYWELDRTGELHLPVDAWLRVEDWERGSPPPEGGNRFRLRTLKLFLDGSFGSRTAALEKPYRDDPGNMGVLFYEDAELKELLVDVTQAGWRVAIHAIGEAAVRQACRVIRCLPERRPGQFRIEHIQHIPEGGIVEAVDAGVVASVQPVHLLDDHIWLETRLGAESCLRTFVWKSFLYNGVSVALGSDWPVASPNPLLNLHIAINRCGFHERPDSTFANGEELEPYQAIRAASHGWAVAAGMEGVRGAIVPGMEASFTAVTGVSDDLRDWSEAKVVSFE